MAEIKRAERVAERVQEELAGMLARDVKDPRVAGVVVSRVTMTDDLRLARVYFRLLVDDDERREAAIAGLGRAAPMLRSGVTKRAGLRYAPELRFEYDAGQDARMRIEQLLDEVKRERARKG